MQMSANTEREGPLSWWIKAFRDNNLPVLGQSQAAAAPLEGDKSVGETELRRRLLSLLAHDPFFAANLLHLANEQPHLSRLSNLTEALSRVGTDRAFHIVAVAPTLEDWLEYLPDHIKRVRRITARALQDACTAAGNVAPDSKIYTAMLLARLGEAAIVMFSPQVSQGLTLTMQFTRREGDMREAHEHMLGFTEEELQAAICEVWKLPKMGDIRG